LIQRLILQVPSVHNEQYNLPDVLPVGLLRKIYQLHYARIIPDIYQALSIGNAIT
jgi:hypothetical protein